MTGAGGEAGALSQLLEDLARIPRVPVPDAHHEGLEPGAAVGRFVLRREIGRGGFGVVYEAADPVLGRSVALKMLRPGVGAARSESDWIQAEAEAVARLNHPSIVTIHEAGHSEHGAYLVFELLEGEGLDRRIARGGMTVGEIVQVVAAVASALRAAHAAGVLHRDLKPANVFLCTSGVVKVLDFGIAQLFDRSAVPGSGTPGYMAPEQREGESGEPRSDLYALGVVLRQMLAAHHPRWTERSATAALERLADEMAAEEPDRRPPSADAVLARIPGQGKLRRTAIATSVVLFAIVAAVAAAAWRLRTGTGPGEAPPGERVVVAVAPVANGAGVPTLDTLSEYVRVALQDSPRLRFLAPERLEAPVAGPAVPEGSDPEAEFRARAHGLGAEVVLQPIAGRGADGLTVRLAAVEARTGREIAVEAAMAPTVEAMPRALDGALRALRTKLRERAGDQAETFRSAAAVSTPSLPAFAEWVAARRCIANLAETEGRDVLTRCSPQLKRALELDPSFALAHRDLAFLLALDDRSDPEARKHVEAALADPGRLTRRDGAIALAVRDRISGDDDAAVKRYAALVSADPGDVSSSYAAGEILFHAARHADAIPYLARVSGLATTYPWALDHLVESLALSGRQADLERLLDQVGEPGPNQVRAVVRGEGWLGRHDRAIERARRAEGSLGGQTGSVLLLQALSAAGRLAEAESLAGSMGARDPANSVVFVHRVVIALRRGRASEAWRLMESPEATEAGLSRHERAVLKVAIATAQRDLGRARAELGRLTRADAAFLGSAAPQVAVLGGTEDVRSAARLLPPGSTASGELAALDAWKAGRTDEAAAALADLEAGAPRPADALSPAYLLAEVAMDRDPAEALAAADRFRRRIPMGPSAGWTHGRSLLLSAEASWRLGRPDDARAFLAILDTLLEDADDDFPLVLDARALRRKVEAGETPPRRSSRGPG